MIANDQELTATLERIRRLQAQLAHLRIVETNPVNYRLSASGFLTEVDRMQLEVREYLSLHPTDLKATARGGIVPCPTTRSSSPRLAVLASAADRERSADRSIRTWRRRTGESTALPGNP